MLVMMYLTAIVLANLSVFYFGPSVAVLNAFLFIGLDLTTRDSLHEKWSGKHLWIKMLLLIGTGSLLSWVLNYNAGRIAIASFVAFACAGLVDTIGYWLLGNKSKLIKINGSNAGSALVDSLIFPILAFGLPILWFVIIGQFAAKVFGGFIWSKIFIKTFD